MRTYLFGISKLARRLKKEGYLDEYSIDGLFDNAAEKYGSMSWGIPVEKPFYAPDIQPVLTVKEAYHIDMVCQLLDLGYRKFVLFHAVSGGEFEKREYDYSRYKYEEDKGNLVLLYLEYRSYSNIGALKYLKKSGQLNSYAFRMKVFTADRKNPDYYYDLAAAGYIITERSWGLYGREEIKAKVIQTWHGFPLKAMEHMMTEYNAEENRYTEKQWSSFDYILSYGLNYTVFMSACYGTLRRQFIVTGMPRNDLLYITDGKKNLEEKIPASKGKKILLYMPTFRELNGTKNGNEDGYLFYWNDFDLNGLQSFCQENNLFFLFKLHPSDTSKVVSWCVESDCMGLLTDEMLGAQCLYEYLNAADVLITDYSSVYFDYLLLDRPVLFTDSDAGSYGENRGFIMEPVDFWRPGPVVHTFERFMQELESAVKGQETYGKARRQLLPFVHCYQDAGSSQRLIDFMRSEQEAEC